MRLKCLQRYNFSLIEFACNNVVPMFLLLLFLSFSLRGAWRYMTDPAMIFRDWLFLFGGLFGAAWSIWHMRPRRDETRFLNNRDAHNDVYDPMGGK